MNVKLAGWDSTASRKRMSASPVPVKMQEPVWTDTTATPVSANLVSEVIIIIAFIKEFLYCKTYKSVDTPRSVSVIRSNPRVTFLFY